jgi:hypothetical protein
MVPVTLRSRLTLILLFLSMEDPYPLPFTIEWRKGEEEFYLH